jgi:hypothetical protein
MVPSGLIVLNATEMTNCIAWHADTCDYYYALSGLAVDLLESH